MVLRRDLLSKSMRKGRARAVELLGRLARAGGLPEPVYEHKGAGSPKKPKHFLEVRFKIPGFLLKESDFETRNIVAGGIASQKAFAKSLAALEAVHRLENTLKLKRGGLAERVEAYEKRQRQLHDEITMTPIEKEIEGLSWASFPIDTTFVDVFPASRRARIEFNPGVWENPKALAAAKELTLSAKETLPVVSVHSNHTERGSKQWANIELNGRFVADGRNLTDENLRVDRQQAEALSLRNIGRSHYESYPECIKNPSSSFGMAKLFTSLPKHQFRELKLLLQSLTPRNHPAESSTSTRGTSTQKDNKIASTAETESILKERIKSFRQHQQGLSLPVDSVEDKIPHDALVTVVRGGTGSGKTTRYPLMLSLFSPRGPSTKVLVAQPRRLACQTAARRVAFEQDVALGADGCPIGYAIRFESFPSKADSRTLDFETPGVVLRQAMSDPLLSDISHLIMDEVHERNAGMDLLLALAKDVLKQRVNHPTLPPLQVVLMSATLDVSHWESYFESNPVAIVDVPKVRRFPIDIIHLGDSDFPLKTNLCKDLLNHKAIFTGGRDEALWDATAQLACKVFRELETTNGSILCFLPGIEEIRKVALLVA